MTIEDTYAPESIRQTAQDRLALDQLGIALRNLRPNHILMPTFGVIICIMFSRWVDVRQLTSWFVLLIASVIPLGVIAMRFPKLDVPASDSGKWSFAATLSYLLFTVVWSCLGFVLWAPGDDLNHMLIMLLLCCTLAGNGALIGASAPISITAYLVYGAAIVLVPLQGSGMIYWGLSGLAFFYAGYLAWMSKQYFDTTRAMLLLRNDKNDLIAALAASKEQSDVARYRAEAASRAKSQFLANMSHELRTPLNAILGFSELIQSGTFRTDVARHLEYAGLIHTSGAHLLTLINDILDLAKIEAGGFTLRERDVDMRAVMADCQRLMMPKAQEGALSLTLDIELRLPHVLADERALKQIVLNLLSNAIKFTPPGGRVTLFARVESDDRLLFGVTDSGVGIALEDQEHVFENFGQGRHDIVTADKGTGLGLPIVKGLVDAHGGDITLLSETGIGTRITVALPPVRVRAAAELRAAS